MVELGGALINFPIFGHIIDNLFVKNIHSPHFFVNKRQILDILSCVLNHCLSEWSLFPKVSIVLHLGVYLIFLGVYLACILFKKVIQADVDVPVIVMLQEIRDQSVCNLRVKDKVAYQIVLTY